MEGLPRCQIVPCAFSSEANQVGVAAAYFEAMQKNKDQAWWCLTDAAGEMTTVGVADIELHDGGSYAFTYTKG